MLQDRALELLQRPTGLKPQLLPQQRARLPIRRQCIGLAASAIQRAHQLSAQPFLQRGGRQSGLDLADQFTIDPEGQVGVDSILNRCQLRFLDPRDHTLRERHIGEFSQWLAAPQL